MIQNIEVIKQSLNRTDYWGAYIDEVLYLDIEKAPDSHPHQNNPAGYVNMLYQPQLCIFDSNKELLQALSTVLPGKIYPRYKDPEAQINQGFGLGLSRAVDCFKFIEWISPYLHYKSDQAQIFMDFLRQKREVKRELEGLKKVPRYSSPEERMEVEEGIRNDLIEAKNKTSSVVYLPPTERLAAIVDASMYLGIYSTHRTNTLSNQTTYDAHGGINSVHRGLLEGIYNQYGGSEPVPSKERKWKYSGGLTYSWQIDGYTLTNILEDVSPYLLFKQDQAKLVLDFLTTRKIITITNHELITQKTEILEGYLNQWSELG